MQAFRLALLFSSHLCGQAPNLLEFCEVLCAQLDCGFVVGRSYFREISDGVREVAAFSPAVVHLECRLL
jgi:hypothetical protein